jgi:uncharacterized protein YlxW (UPF0749 family)
MTVAGDDGQPEARKSTEPGASTVRLSAAIPADPAESAADTPLGETTRPSAVPDLSAQSVPDPSAQSMPEPGAQSAPDPSARDAAGSGSAADDPAGMDPAGMDPAGMDPERSLTARDDRIAAGSAVATIPDRGQRPSQLAPWRRLSSAGALIWVLIALFGFTLVVQLRSNDTDQGLATTRQEDLVRILSDLEARETRLNAEIGTLEESQRQLNSGVAGREAALAEAKKRADELGLLAGTLPGQGPGLEIRITPGGAPIKASALLNTVQELRGAGGEVMQLAGSDGTVVRVVASTSFVEGDGGAVVIDGIRLSAPYLLTVIGSPETMRTALNIPGGVVASVANAGGNVDPQPRKTVDVTALRKATTLQYARPVS